MTITALERSAWEHCLAAFMPKPPPPPRRWASPLDMAADLDKAIVRTKALEVINAAIVDLIDDRIPGNKLVVEMPPQQGKSMLCSYWLPLWILVCVNPDTRILDISYTDEMARRWGADVKRALEEKYNGDDGSVDLGLKLRADSHAAGRWQIEGHRGGIYCAGVNGSITGKSAELIEVDDPIKGLKEAQSDATRKAVMDVWRGAIFPRVRGSKTKLLWIQTLWHEEEPISQILASNPGGWRVVRIPAICDSADDPLGRAIGEPMESATGDVDWEEVRKVVGPHVFSAMYQQRPEPAEGGLFKRIFWRHFTRFGNILDLGGRQSDLRDAWRFATIDLANSTRTAADFTVIGAWARTLGGDLILLDMVRAKIGEAEHFAHARPLIERYSLDTVFVEASQYGTTLVKQATQAGVPITPIQAEIDKFSRALPYSAWVAAGRVWLPANAHWVDTWISEHAAFPGAGKHDDCVDVGSLATRVSVTRAAPTLPASHPSRSSGEIDFMKIPL